MDLETEAQRKGHKKNTLSVRKNGVQDHNKWLFSPLGGLGI